MVLHPKPTTKLVRTHSAHFWCWDKPQTTLDSLDSPRPKLGGSHHLPPYSILCISPLHLHLNGTFSRDFQSGVPKLSRFGFPGLWAFITSRSNLRLGRGLKQTCSSPWELSRGVLHFTCTHRDRVDSWRLVVESQTINLTLGPSFAYNLCCRCPNGSCEAILDIYTSRPFQQYKLHFNARCFDPCNRALSFWESRRTPKSHFRECEWRPHTSLKVGLRQRRPTRSITTSPLPTRQSHQSKTHIKLLTLKDMLKHELVTSPPRNKSMTTFGSLINDLEEDDERTYSNEIGGRGG